MSPHSNFGDQIEDYEILHLLGKGGFAIVYKARCKKTNKVVALKMIDKTLIQYAGLASRVRQEVEIHSRLKHPSVLELYTFFQDAKHVYLVLEWAQNGELNRYIKEKLGRPMTESEAANILYQVVAGLLYLHSHNIIHRDISLSNLLLNENMQVKIADFGLATQLKQPNETHTTMCGTPNYISPEVVSRSSHGLTADLWSLGCMFYTLLLGQPPFDTDEVQSTLTKVVISNYELPDHLSYEARDLIDRLLRKNPSDRIPLEEILNHRFMQCYKPFNLVGQVMSTAKYNQSTASSDSGIVTCSSSSAHQLQYSNSRGKMQTRPLESIDNTKYNSAQNFNYCNNLDDYSKSGAWPLKPLEPKQVNYFANQWQPHVNTAFSEPCEKATYAMQHMHLDDQQNGSQKYECQNVKPFTRACSYESPASFRSFPAATTKSTKSVENISSIPPLNTKRLLPTRYKTKNAVMSIQANGDVVVEFIKYKSKFNEDRIVDICWISGDGHNIHIYQPDPGRGLPLRDKPPELVDDDNYKFSYFNLPEKHRKKYAYAARFINLVKRKTPKLTYFSPQAKCHLMESKEDFEVLFYNGAKVTKSPDGAKVYDQRGQLLHDHSELIAASLLEHQRECYENCRNICTALENVEMNGITCFPIVIGRRPSGTPAQREYMRTPPRGQQISFATAKSQDIMDDFSMYTVSSARSEKMNTEEGQSNINVPIRRTNLENIGIATELSNGIIQVQFYDGSIISVIPETHGDGITYIQSNGISTYFGPRDPMPLHVKEKFNHLPLVRERLKNAPYMEAMRKRPSSTPIPKSAKFMHMPHMRMPHNQQQTIKFLR